MIFPDLASVASILLAYGRLSADPGVAEFQKDVLAEVMREELPGGVAFLEDVEPGAQSHVAHPIVWVDCLSCLRANDSSVFVAGSARVLQTAPDAASLDLSFKVSTPPGRTEVWSVRVRKQDARYFLATDKALAPRMAIDAAALRVEPCSGRVNCTPDDSFESPAQAEQLRTVVAESLPARSIAAGKPVRRQDLKAVMLIHSGDSVRVTYALPSGGLEVTTKGRALDTRGKGEKARVEIIAPGYDPFARNARSTRIIETRVTGDHEVTYER